jgi:hypothetical protein
MNTTLRTSPQVLRSNRGKETAIGTNETVIVRKWVRVLGVSRAPDMFLHHRRQNSVQKSSDFVKF